MSNPSTNTTNIIPHPLDYPVDSWFNYVNTPSNPGVYLTWERKSANVAFYVISSSPSIDGTYTAIATLDFPAYEYIDINGNGSNFYKITELAQNGSIISTFAPIMGSELLINASLMYEIRHLMNIHVESEQGIFEHINRSSCRFVHGYWNSYPKPEIRISGASQQGNIDSELYLDDVNLIYNTTNNTVNNYPTGLKIMPDYNGRLFFLDSNQNPVNIQSYDTIYASYWVRLFSYSQLNSYLYMALQAINSQAGTMKFDTVGQTPNYYDAALITGATYYLLRSLNVQLKNREFRLLLADPDDKEIFSNLREDARQYKEDFDKFLESVPRAVYPTSKTIVTPEYNLPGGRSRFFRYAFKGAF